MINDAQYLWFVFHVLIINIMYSAFMLHKKKLYIDYIYNT